MAALDERILMLFGVAAGGLAGVPEEQRDIIAKILNEPTERVEEELRKLGFKDEES